MLVPVIETQRNHAFHLSKKWFRQEERLQLKLREGAQKCVASVATTTTQIKHISGHFKSP